MKHKDDLLLILTGRSQKELIGLDTAISSVSSHLLHPEVIREFLNLQERAKKEDIDLQIASSTRSYERQLKIWNKKASGEIPLFSDDESTLDIKDLNDQEALAAILKYSAIPGTSRHHWGTDLDVFDKNALPHPDYKISLTKNESEEIFSRLNTFLKKDFSNPNSSFFFPFDGESTKISKEPWHISHRKKSKEFEQNYTFDIFIQNLTYTEDRFDWKLRNEVLKNPKYYFEHYFFKQSARIKV